MMDRLISKLGLLLACLFSLFFLAFLAEILYVFLSRRHVIDCLKRQSSGRVLDPTGADHRETRVPSRSESTTPVASVEDLVKMQQTYARLLSTIQEEEDKEGIEFSSERPPSPHDPLRHISAIAAAGESMETLTAQVKSCCDDKTPFDTPCDSPVAYFTPNASPHG